MLQVETIERMTPGQLLQHYLMASYCYYHMDESPMTDAAFDRLCVRLHAALPTLNHPHKMLVTYEDLEAGTCLLSFPRYPKMVVDASWEYTALCSNGEMLRRLEPHLLPPPVRAPRVARSRPAAPTAPSPPAPRTRVVRTRRA